MGFRERLLWFFCVGGLGLCFSGGLGQELEFDPVLLRMARVVASQERRIKELEVRLDRVVGGVSEVDLRVLRLEEPGGGSDLERVLSSWGK